MFVAGILAAMKTGRRDDVQFLGMNKFAEEEAKALRAKGVKVDVIKQSDQPDTITTGEGPSAQHHDLRTDDGRKNFVKTLGLPAPQSQQIENVLKRAGADTRDELARLAQAWAPGEKGQAIPGRLVLSGHSGGTSIYGDESGFRNGYLNVRSVTDLARAMPKAAGQVEDLALSACYAGQEKDMANWRQGFPNLKTAIGYHDKSPSGIHADGSRAHLQRWADLTKGDKANLKPEDFKGLEKAKFVATWNHKEGYRQVGQEGLGTVQQRASDFQRTYDRIFQGDAPSGEQALRGHYNDLQAIRNRAPLSPEDYRKMEDRIETAFRLMKYDKVKTNFQKDHGAEIGQAAAALGLPAPDFGAVSRKDALATIAKFEAAAKAQRPSPATAEAVRKLTEGLRDLHDPHVIPRHGL